MNDGKIRLWCHWENMQLPPPVRRARLWGTRAPETQDAVAEDCAQYQEK